MRLPLVLILLTSTAASANEYQSITQLSHSNFDEVMSTDNSTAINSVYYFDKKRALGPLSEFEYINTTNNVFGSYFNNSDSNFAFGGQVFYDQWQVGGAYITNDSDNIDASQTEFTLGYLLTQNLLINVQSNCPTPLALLNPCRSMLICMEQARLTKASLKPPLWK